MQILRKLGRFLFNYLVTLCKIKRFILARLIIIMCTVAGSNPDIDIDECAQILELKVAQIFQKMPKK